MCLAIFLNDNWHSSFFMTKYTPIDCRYYDVLELNASRKTTCTIAFFETEKSVRTVESTIQDIFTKDKEEFLKLPDGTEIRLDKILSVNDTKFYGHCS